MAAEKHKFSTFRDSGKGLKKNNAQKFSYFDR